ncbi:protein phosphatase 1 regulatory subunit 15A [Saccopteryx leptura]|uniref:protein phosphatase 1 regulatory subunit 15A n=1 Tax=Saccopteryx leptura TaxID=249018 RepID=UPI00339CDD79
MAPGQVPHQPPWRDAHAFFLLSPLMGLFSRAWSRLRGSEPPEPWLVEAVRSADHEEARLEGEVQAALVSHYAPWGKHSHGEARDSGTAVEDGESSWEACLDLKADTSLLQAWGLSDGNDEEYGGEEATSIPKEQGSEYTGGQPAFLSPSFLKTLQDHPGEESEEGGVAGDKVVTFSLPPSHWECCAGVEEGKIEEAVNKKAPRTSTSPFSPGPKPRAWVYCAGEEEARAKEEERTENKEAGRTFIFPSSAGSHPSAWECYSGKKSEDKDGKTEKGDADPEPCSSFLAQRPLLGTWQHLPSKITEEEEENSASGEAEDLSATPAMSAFMKAWVCYPGEDTEEEEAESPSFISPTSTFLRAWVYRPGEDTEEEEEEEEEVEDSDSGAADEEGEADSSSSMPPTNTFLRAWVYRPGEDTEEEKEEGEEEEDSDSGIAEEEGEAEGSSSIPPTSAFMKAWVYRPGENTEEEEEEADSEAAGSEPHSSLQAPSALLRGGTYPPGKETEGEAAAEELGEALSHPFRVAIYLPGEKPPPPWPLPRLPLQLRRRLKYAKPPTQHLDPETSQTARKVRFSEKVSIHFLVVWAGPAQAARRGPWEQLARDHSRFARRIAQAEEKLSPCLSPAARARAWDRLGNPSSSLAAITQAVSTSSVQATPLSHTVASPSPLCMPVSPGLDLSGRRG